MRVVQAARVQKREAMWAVSELIRVVLILWVQTDINIQQICYLLACGVSLLRSSWKAISAWLGLVVLVEFFPWHAMLINFAPSPRWVKLHNLLNFALRLAVSVRFDISLRAWPWGSSEMFCPMSTRTAAWNAQILMSDVHANTWICWSHLVKINNHHKMIVYIVGK